MGSTRAQYQSTLSGGAVHDDVARGVAIVVAITSASRGLATEVVVGATKAYSTTPPSTSTACRPRATPAAPLRRVPQPN